MNGRNKVDKTDGVYNLLDFDIVTLNGIDPKTGRPKVPYAIFAISDTEFINGGEILTKVAKAFVDNMGGDIEAAREAFRNSGGMKVKLKKGLTASGNNITKVEVL